MKNWIKGAGKHFIIGGLLIIYLLSANSLFVAFFLRNGKPVQEKTALPPETDQIYFHIDSLSPVRYDGEDLYELRGYAFTKTAAEPADFTIKIVLHSPTQDLVFNREPVARPDVTQALQSTYKKNLDKSGFRMFISKDVLKIENYQIGILLEGKQGSSRYYIKTGQYIERTPNTLRFIVGP